MALSITNTNPTVGTTEFWLFSNSTTKVDQTTDQWVQIGLDLNALALGDEFEFRMVEMVDTTNQRNMFPPIRFLGPCEVEYWTPPFLLGNGYEASLKKIAGTDRAIPVSIRKTT